MARHPASDPEREISAVADALRDLLADGPRRRQGADRGARRDVDHVERRGRLGQPLRVPPSGTWERRSADIYAAAEDWLGRTSDATPDDGRRAAGPPLPGGIRSGIAQGHRELGGDLAGHTRACVGTDAAATVPRRAGRGTGRSPARSAPRSPTSLSRPVLADMGRDAARSRSPDADPARTLPSAIFDTKTPHSFPRFLIDGQVAGAGSPKAGEWW